MSTIESICVYCASGPGNNPAFMDAARKLGRTLAENRIRLVYGGGSVGLMGALAEAVLDHGGTVIGVLPDLLVNREALPVRVQARVDPADHARHARAQTGDVRARRRLRRASGRRRHARGAGRAADLGAAWPAQETDPDPQHRQLLGAALRAARPDGTARLHPRGSAGQPPGGRAGRGDFAETVRGGALRFRSGKEDDVGGRRADVEPADERKSAAQVRPHPEERAPKGPGSTTLTRVRASRRMGAAS